MSFKRPRIRKNTLVNKMLHESASAVSARKVPFAVTISLSAILVVGGCSKRDHSTGHETSVGAKDDTEISLIKSPGTSSSPPAIPSNDADPLPVGSTLGQFRVVEVRTQPVLKSGSSWVQDVPLASGVQRFAMKMAAQTDLGQARIGVVAFDDVGILRSVTGEPLAISGGQAGSIVGTPDFVRRVPGDVKVVFVGNNLGGSQPPIRIAAIVLEKVVADVVKQGTNPKWSALVDEDAITRGFGKGLARLTVDNGYCSGFAITPQLLITNYHCVRRSIARAVNPCASMQIAFNYLDDANPDRAIPASCQKLVANDEVLDYAILEFRLVRASDAIQVFSFTDPERAQPDSKLMVLHYPEGLAAQITKCDGPPRPIDLNLPAPTVIAESRRLCKMNSSAFYKVREEQVRKSFQYTCDTSPGSSGSPVLINGSVVGLHFSWDYRYYDSVGKIPDSYEAVACLETRLKLQNWAKNICAIMQDAKEKAPGAGIPQC